jgi:exonuclease SbcC
VQLASELKANTQQQQALDAECQQLQAQIAQWRSEHPELDDAGLDRLLAMDDAQVNELRQRCKGAEKPSSRAACCCRNVSSACNNTPHK